jgi:beta-lactamase regulating signal transducer with metallopeptidase domain
MLWWLAETTMVAAVVAVAVALLCRRLRPRPAVAHALWLVVLLKLLAPPLPAWPWPTSAPQPIVEQAPRPPPEPQAEEPAAPPLPEPIVLAPPSDPVDDPAPPLESDPVPVVEESPSSPAVTEEPPAIATPSAWWPDVSAVLVSVWIGGAVLMTLWQLLRIARFRRQVAHGVKAPVPLTALVSDTAAQLGVRAPPVLVVPGLASPVVWGFGRARLLWPAALLGQLSPDSERAAVIHELAHLRRRDHWVGWLQLIAGCVWWWSPLFWLVRRQLGRAAESACDAWVIETLPRARRAYAEALLAVCELVSRRAAPAPALGMGGLRQEIERRLTMIMRESVPSRAPVRALFGVVLLALIALPGFTDGQPPAPARTTEKADAYQVPANQAQPAAKVAVDQQEQRLQKLEATLEALLKEVRDMRGGKSAPATKPAPSNTPKIETGRVAENSYALPSTYQPYAYWAAGQVAGQPSGTVHLERVTYTLPKEKGEALAALLKDLKAPVMETQVKPDSIVVTTTPAAQHVVGEFVALLQGKATAAPNKASHTSPYYPAPGK